jgi:hypothetical protein
MLVMTGIFFVDDGNATWIPLSWGKDLDTKEIKLLKTLTYDCNPENGIDFEAIAAQISTKLKIQKRHKFQLFQNYQKKLNLKNKTFWWTNVKKLKIFTWFQCPKLNPITIPGFSSFLDRWEPLYGKQIIQTKITGTCSKLQCSI